MTGGGREWTLLSSHGQVLLAVAGNRQARVEDLAERVGLSRRSVLSVLREFYAEEPFVRVVDHLPGTKDSVGTNFCDLTARIVRGRVLTISCLDNLVKGASGAAVQNFNLMYGHAETTAL